MMKLLVGIAALGLACALGCGENCDVDAFEAAVGSFEGDSYYDKQFDYDGDGSVSSADFGVFLERCEN